MKRLQIYIEDELNEALAHEAARTKTSKAAVIRSIVGERLRPASSGRDPLDDVVGAIDVDVQPGDIDEVVYGS